jgi:hypothetical protein
MSATPRRFARVTDRLAAGVQSRLAGRGAESEAGMTTAEYAVGTVAACGLGGVLYKVVTSPSITQVITHMIEDTISSFFQF